MFLKTAIICKSDFFFFLQVPSCSDTEVDQLFVVHWPAEDQGGYRRGLNATLVACHLTLPVAYGLYQCHLNRSRGSAVELWSVLIQATPTTIEAVTSEGPSINPAIRIGKENIANIHNIKFGILINYQKSLFVACYLLRVLCWSATWCVCGLGHVFYSSLHVLLEA